MIQDSPTSIFLFVPLLFCFFPTVSLRSHANTAPALARPPSPFFVPLRCPDDSHPNSLNAVTLNGIFHVEYAWPSNKRA